ncbi:hypothetical protein FHG87_016919, partial [Trinorchestia longiramus]
MATGTMKESPSSASGGAIYYNIPASAPGSHNTSKCLLTDGSEASMRSSLHLASRNSSTLEAASLESVPVGQQQVDAKKSSPSKLPVLKSKSASVAAKRTTISKVLKKKANKEKSGLGSSAGTENNILLAYQNYPQASSETNSANETDFTCREDPASSKLAKKKTSSGSGIFGSWLRKKGKESRCPAKSLPPLPVITVENVDSCASDQLVKKSMNLEMEVDFRENAKNDCGSFEFSPRAVSGVSWKFNDSAENNVDKPFRSKISASDHCSLPSSASTEKDTSFQRASDSSFESFGQSPTDIYSKQTDMNLTNESMRSTCDNFSGTSVCTLEADQAEAPCTENKTSCFNPSSVDYCNLNWSDGNYQVLKTDSDTVDDRAECMPVQVHDGFESRGPASIPVSISTHFSIMSVHNANYPFVEGSISQLGDSQDVQISNDASGPYCWQHLLKPHKSLICSHEATRNSHSRLTGIVEGENVSQSSIVAVASTVNSVSEDIDKSKCDVGSDNCVSKSMENTAKFPAVDRKIASHNVSSALDLIPNCVITLDTTTSLIENVIKDETGPTQENALSTVDSETGNNLMKSKVLKDVPVTGNVNLSTQQNYSYEEPAQFSKFEATTSVSRFPLSENCAQISQVTSNEKLNNENLLNCSSQKNHVKISNIASNSNTVLTDPVAQQCDLASNRVVERDTKVTHPRENNPSNFNLPDKPLPDPNCGGSRINIEASGTKNNSEEYAVNEVCAVEEVPSVDGELQSDTVGGTKDLVAKSTSEADTTDTDEEELESAIGHQTTMDLSQRGSKSVVSSVEIFSTSYTAKASYVKPKAMTSTVSSASVVQQIAQNSVKPSGFSNDLYLVCGGENKTPSFETCPDLVAPQKIPGTFTYYDLSNKPRDLVVNECYPCLPPTGNTRRFERLDPVTYEPGDFDPSLLQRLFALDLEVGTSEYDREITRGIRTNLVDWQKKSEWLTKKRRMKTFRNLGGSSSEVVILHASDGTAWAHYLGDFLLNSLSYRPCTFPSVPAAAADGARTLGSADSAVPSGAASNPVYASSVPSGAASNPVYASSAPSGAASNPVYASSVPSGAASNPVYASSVPSGAASNPVYASSVPSGAASNPVYASSVPSGAASNPVYAISKNNYVCNLGSACTDLQTTTSNHPASVCCCSQRLHQRIHPRPSVECRNVEQVLGPSVPPILAQRLHTARVQIVVITPGFLSHVNDPQLDLGRVVVPRRVLGLMVGTSCADVNDRHLGALFSFKEWPLVAVQRPSVWLCAAVLSRALRVLCSSRVYKGYCSEPPRGAFRICPSRVSE